MIFIQMVTETIGLTAIFLTGYIVDGLDFRLECF